MPVRLKAGRIGEVKVLFRKDEPISVIGGNCDTVMCGGEQPEMKEQSAG
jgi:hypothetical protein